MTFSEEYTVLIKVQNKTKATVQKKIKIKAEYPNKPSTLGHIDADAVNTKLECAICCFQ